MHDEDKNVESTVQETKISCQNAYQYVGKYCYYGKCEVSGSWLRGHNINDVQKKRIANGKLHLGMFNIEMQL